MKRLTMYCRLLNITQSHSAFLFGARNTGKSTLLARRFSKEQSMVIDLLDYAQEMRFAQNPNELHTIVTSLPDQVTHLIIDEVQKLPVLLDVVQRLMRETKKYFIMTGSSARKLKHGGANLLAGRAFVYHLFPLSCFELGDDFNLHDSLEWGTLPEVLPMKNNHDKQQFLSAYANTYLKEEIWGEHFVRRLAPFRRFLEVAAQCNGNVINFANIARDTGVNEKTVASYYSILEDTLIGFFLEAHHNSYRKRVGSSPKFYFFDTGVVRALTGMTSVPLKEKTHDYGDAFEHFIILECMRLGSYLQPDYKFSFIRTYDGVEIDLVIERPGASTLLIVIKSTDTVEERMLSSLQKISSEFTDAEAICLSRDPYLKAYGDIKAMPWQQGLGEIFEIS